QAGDISAKKGHSALIPIEHHEIPRILFLACGDSSDFSELRQSIQAAISKVLRRQYQRVSILADAWQSDDINLAQLLQQIGIITTTQSYQYDSTLSKKAEAPALKSVYVFTDNVI